MHSDFSLKTERERAERLLYLCVYGTSSFFSEKVVSYKIRLFCMSLLYQREKEFQSVGVFSEY